ncbi:MAG TPA: hypothetical protein PKY50_02870 [Candidatus Competibacter sp.]|nr:hypothetical protein [Candidatus Competibacter sp.]
MAQMQTLSIRIPDEDFQWLSSLQEADAKTPSEKLRALLARIRKQEAGMTSPELCAAWMQALARPFADTVSVYERQHKIHSDLVGLVSEWIPRIMATLVSARLSEGASQKEALDVEAVLAQQCFRLFASLLRAAVTTHPATYDEGVLDRYLPDIIEIADIIATRKRKELNNG